MVMQGGHKPKTHRRGGGMEASTGNMARGGTLPVQPHDLHAQD